MTQYLLAVHGDETAAPPAEEMQRAYQQVDGFNDKLRASGAWVFAGGLHPASTATVVRSEGGRVVTTDGRSPRPRNSSAASGSSRRTTSTVLFAINAVHSDAATAADTDWAQILALYDQPFGLAPTPVVALKRAVALAEEEGAAAGLAATDGLLLEAYHPSTPSAPISLPASTLPARPAPPTAGRWNWRSTPPNAASSSGGGP